MLYAIRKIFAAPYFPEDEDKTRSAAILNIISQIIIGVLLLFFLGRVATRAPINNTVNMVLLGVVVANALTLFASHRGYVHAASLFLVSIGWIGLSYLAWRAEGIRDVGFFGYFVPILMAGLLLGWRGAVGFTALSCLSGWALAYAETRGWLVIVALDKPLNFAGYMTGMYIITAALIYFMITTLQNALDRSRSSARELASSNNELSALRVELEQRVEERTAQLEKRAAQMEAISSVAREMASVQDIDALLPSITKLISRQFGFYHVGIFLLDENRRNAVLRASNSLGGQQMLRKQHTLSLDSRSIVGYSIVRGEPRIALDVGVDAVYFNNPDLPDTRSEMALPLRVSGQIMGSLDVQSTELNAFTQEDVDVLTTLADQVALAIENARLFGEAKSALTESRAMFEKYSQLEWSTFARQVKQTGYVFDGKQMIPLDNSVKRETTRAVAQTGSLSLEKESASIGIPIKLRGQTIGVLDVRSKKGPRQWKQDEISILEAAAERAALALENSRLVLSAQRRAARERAIGDISAKIGSVSNLESILQTAVEELGRKIGGAAEVSLEISTDDGTNAQ
jgi:GAF domain-containing protein